jgi:hypothetical protein
MVVFSRLASEWGALMAAGGAWLMGYTRLKPELIPWVLIIRAENGPAGGSVIPLVEFPSPWLYEIGFFDQSVCHAYWPISGRC